MNDMLSGIKHRAERRRSMRRASAATNNARRLSVTAVQNRRRSLTAQTEEERARLVELEGVEDRRVHEHAAHAINPTCQHNTHSPYLLHSPTHHSHAKPKAHSSAPPEALIGPRYKRQYVLPVARRPDRDAGMQLQKTVHHGPADTHPT